MDRLEEIQGLLNQIKAKHGTAAAFEFFNFWTPDGPKFKTYIAHDVGPGHKQHDSLDDAVQRFKDFLEVDDLFAYNKELARFELKRLIEKKEDIEAEIYRLQQMHWPEE